MKHHSLSILIPAAGASQRLGQPKQLVQYQGKSLIQRAIENAEVLTSLEIIVVTGAHADSIESLVQNTSARSVYNPDWSAGMGGSIATGADAVDENTSGVLIVLCDQWGIQAQDLQLLAQTWLADTDRIVCAEAEGHLGPPVIFPSSCLAKLRALNGDLGARSIIEKKLDSVFPVPMQNAALDLDTPNQLDELKHR